MFVTVWVCRLTRLISLQEGGAEQLTRKARTTTLLSDPILEEHSYSKVCRKKRGGTQERILKGNVNTNAGASRRGHLEREQGMSKHVIAPTRSLPIHHTVSETYPDMEVMTSLR